MSNLSSSLDFNFWGYICVALVVICVLLFAFLISSAIVWNCRASKKKAIRCNGKEAAEKGRSPSLLKRTGREMDGGTIKKEKDYKGIPLKSIDAVLLELEKKEKECDDEEKDMDELGEGEFLVRRNTFEDVDVIVKTKNEITEEKKSMKMDHLKKPKVPEENRLTILPSVFEKMFKKMIYRPELVSIILAEERDPSHSVVQNWFDACQPDFEIPVEIISMSYNNPQKCRDPNVHAWDKSAYLVYGKEFIHASIVTIPGEGEIGKAIICQAPFDDKEEGRQDNRDLFWKMVEDTQAEHIVMCCQHVENGVVKCGRYFPDIEGESQTYGKITVTLIQKRDAMFDGEIVTRTFQIIDKTKEAMKGRHIDHYQFLKWKEGTVPETHAAKEALKYVNSRTRRKLKPIIVHSHLGTGRSCVFVGLEFMCSCICNKTRTNTHWFQIQFRIRRMGALQSGHQLFFVQNTAWDLLIEEFKFNTYAEQVKKQWAIFKMYFEKGKYDRDSIEQLHEFELKKYGRKTMFKGVPGKKIFLLTTTSSIDWKAMQNMLPEAKTQVETEKSAQTDKPVAKE